MLNQHLQLIIHIITTNKYTLESAEQSFLSDTNSTKFHT